MPEQPMATTTPNSPAEVGDEGPLSHEWVVAATVRVSAKTAKHADLRGSFKTAAGQRVKALDTYCDACRRPYDDVADQPCEAKIDNTHLIGGNPGERKKRKVYPVRGEVIPGPRINRFGVEAIVGGGVRDV